MTTQTYRAKGWLCALALLAACDDPPPPNLEEVPSVPSAAPTPAAGAPAAGAAAAEAEPAKPKLVLNDGDFVDTASNRDPFHNYLQDIIGPKEVVREPGRDNLTILKKYALDEIKLQAIITGEVRPRAMFVDPGGLGHTVKRGDYISKSSGRVMQILSDKVVIQIEEQLEGGQRVAERVIEMHPEEKLLNAGFGVVQ